MTATPISTLRQFARPQNKVERCEMCGMEIASEHPHLLEFVNRRLLCSCGACAILFDGQASAKFRRVPSDVKVLADFSMTDLQWESLHLPINLAFFYSSTPAARVVAMFPSPAGATESLLTFESWQDLLHDNPSLARMQPDVEALLVYRIADAREYYIVPIDECFKLVGLIRTHWRGLSGGTEVWKHLKGFFDGLKKRGTNA